MSCKQATLNLLHACERAQLRSVASMHCKALTIVRQSAVKHEKTGCIVTLSNKEDIWSENTLPYTVLFWSSSASTVILQRARN